MGTRGSYEELAARYDLMYADWEASTTRQGKALDALLTTGSPAPTSAPWPRPAPRARRGPAG